jgi:hypothetical protein
VTSKSPKLPPKPPPPKKPKALSKPWAITPTQKADYDSEFRALDTEGTGLVPEEKALRSLRRYQLPSEDLAHIWYTTPLIESACRLTKPTGTLPPFATTTASTLTSSPWLCTSFRIGWQARKFHLSSLDSSYRLPSDQTSPLRRPPYPSPHQHLLAPKAKPVTPTRHSRCPGAGSTEPPQCHLRPHHHHLRHDATARPSLRLPSSLRTLLSRRQKKMTMYHP